jgi:toxin CptA
MDAARLLISLRPSRRLTLALVLAYLSAASAVAATDLPLWLTIPVGSALLAYGAVTAARTALLRAADAIVAVQAGRPDRLPFQTRDGAWHEGRLLGTSYVAPYLTVLNLSEPGTRRPRHVLILPDGIDAEDFRRLRVWLRWGRPGPL